MYIVDILRKVMELNVNYTIDELNNLLTKNNIEYTVTKKDLAVLSDQEFSVMTIGEDENLKTYIRRKGADVVKLPPNVPH